MRINIKFLAVLCCIAFTLTGLSTAANEPIAVDVNLDVRHALGDIDTFDRKKFVTIHADVTEQEWDGNNFTPDLRDHFLNGYDVYMGRNTGPITWWLNAMIAEDPVRSGFASPESIESYGQGVIDSYASNTNYHAYEFRNEQVICAQLHPFWPDGQTTQKGWSFSQADTPGEPFGTATGEYMGRFINEYFGTGGATGQNRPDIVEVINEPMWHLVDYGSEVPEKIFRFHKTVADEIRKYNSNITVGGYCTAFPDLDKNNFNQWNERWKLFMDMVGEDMDFWSIHLYDFPSINNGKQLYRKGSNMEATFDMMEQYSYMKFGTVKPFVISEYGAQMHDYWGAWSAYRDWLHIKSVNSMMLQFMERANIIQKTINFLIVKAEWGTTGVNDTYNHRLLRKENEPVSYTGQWVYTDMVKTYQLWSNVNGIRVDSKSSSLDLLVDSYVDSNKAYVILNNLEFEPVFAHLNVNFENATVQSVKVKHLFLKDNGAFLDEYVLGEIPDSVNVEAEGTMILEYTFDNQIVIDETSDEVKYYADTYFKPIVANTPESFNINGVEKGSFGEAVLRVGVGRAHEKSLKLTINFNGVELNVPENFRGGPQTDRPNYFGVLEIPVPYQNLQTDNSVSIQFPDDGGHISSVTLRAYKFSRSIERSLPTAVDPVRHCTSSDFQIYPNPNKGNFTITAPSNIHNTTLTILTSRGQTILSHDLVSANSYVSIDMLEPGAYIARIRSNQFNFSYKLIIQ